MNENKLTSEAVRRMWGLSRITTEKELHDRYQLGLWEEHLWPVIRDANDEMTTVYEFGSVTVMLRDDEMRIHTWEDPQ